ncbi:hypothetical protein [Undibacter mobilis]|uniref:Transmembrane protein n=1 Tax=Undibacter mobilis TaxID=2292256 RepID=A0A371B8U3_9BRAD|nr:hypothetical protein [Undibacter mobilis]RDV03843.1 hypothetical protein DXH78_04135 [Undibacter mobilis]
MYLLGFPLLLVPFAIYNIVAFLWAGVSWSDAATRVHLVSGGEWTMSAGDILIAVSLVFLFGEIVKATRIGTRAVVDHALSLLLFLAMMIEFLLVPQAATATFFLLMAISLVDVLAGFAVTLRTAQRDLSVDGFPTSSPTS